MLRHGLVAAAGVIYVQVAIIHTTLVALVTQSRILYGMAREDVVPGVFAAVHPTRRSPWVALILSAAVVVGLLVVGDVLTRLGLDIDLITTLVNGIVLFAAEKAFGSSTRPPGAPPSTADPTGGA